MSANGFGDWVQSQVESYQRLKKWYLMPPCLTLSSISYGAVQGKEYLPPLQLVVEVIEKEPSGCPWLQSPTLLFYSGQMKIIYSQLYGFKYSYLILIIKWFQVIISI